LTDAVEVLDYSAVNVFGKEEMIKKKRVEKQLLGSNNDDIGNGGSRNG
jgi:hypothetical protein